MSHSTLATTQVIADMIKKLTTELAREYGADFKVHVTAKDEVIATYDSVALVPPSVRSKSNPTPMITLHQRLENVGWTPTRMGKPESPLWSATDRGWIKALLECGDETLIIGDLMYQAETVQGN